MFKYNLELTYFHFNHPINDNVKSIFSSLIATLSPKSLHFNNIETYTYQFIVIKLRKVSCLSVNDILRFL